MSPYTLYAAPGWGSCIVEAQLAYYGLPFTLVESGDLLASEKAREQLRPLNALAQIPVLVLPTGEVMTESAAITLHLGDIVGSDVLVPAANAPERAQFLRWLVYLVANIYPVFTYGDIPERFVETEGAAKPFRAKLDSYQHGLWRHMAAAANARGPWYFGDRLTAIDFYLLVMTRWRPRAPWFAEHAPQLLRAAEHAAALPALKAVVARNFPNT